MFEVRLVMNTGGIPKPRLDNGLHDSGRGVSSRVIAASGDENRCAWSRRPGFESGLDEPAALAFVDDVDRLVFAIGTCDAEEHRCPAEEPEFPFLREAPVEDEFPADLLVVDPVLLEDAVHVHLERVADVWWQLDPVVVHRR